MTTHGSPAEGWVLPEGAVPFRDSSPVSWRYLQRQQLIGHRPVLVDVGANVGRTTIIGIEQGYFSRALAIEPDPENFACLQENLARHQLTGAVRPVRCAVSNQNGTARLYTDTKHTNRRLIRPVRSKPDEATVTTETRTLDSFVADGTVALVDIAAVKLDVQGWEGYVLDGASALVADPQIVWVLELSPVHLQAAGRSLSDLLAQCARLFPYALDLRRKPEPAMPATELAGRLEYLTGKSHTDVAFFHARS